MDKEAQDLFMRVLIYEAEVADCMHSRLKSCHVSAHTDPYLPDSPLEYRYSCLDCGHIVWMRNPPAADGTPQKKERTTMEEEKERTTMEETMGFDAALRAVKLGQAIRRNGWKGLALTVLARYPDENSEMTKPYLYIQFPDDEETTPDSLCPWLPSQTDIMAEDWVIVY